MVLSSLKSLSISGGSQQEFDRVSWQKQLTPILNLWKNIYQSLQSFPCNMGRPEAQPVECFVLLEIQSCQTLVTPN